MRARWSAGAACGPRRRRWTITDAAAAKSGRVDVAHRQTDSSLTVDLQHFHADDVAFLQLVADTLHALVGDLRDVHQAVAARQDGDERAEVHQARDLALVDAADLDVRRDQLDAPLRLTAGGAVHRGYLHGAVALDVDGGSGLLGDLADHRPALADHVADLLRIDLQGDDGRSPFRHTVTRLADHLVHLAEDVQAALARLLQRDLHDLGRHALDLDVHLQRGDAVLRSGHLEVHVAEVILIAQDVGEHLVAVALEHEAHRDTGYRGLDRHAGIHQRKGAAADARHRARSVGFQDLRHDPDDIREGRHVGHHRVDAAAGKVAVADLAALRRAHHSGLADREGREVVVQHEGLAALALQAVDDLRIAGGAERRHDERL